MDYLMLLLQQAVGTEPNVTLNLQNTVGLMLAGILWLSRNKIKAYDEHLAQCQKRDIDRGKQIEKVAQLQARMVHVDNTVEWMADCVHKMAGQLNIQVESRPKRDL